jgi:sterol 3beta-glucosyltransferase
VNIVLVTYGTRGDVQPFVALGSAMQRKGHHVRLCGPAGFAQFVRSAGIEFTAVADDPASELAAAQTYLRKGKVVRFYRSRISRLSELWGELGKQMMVATVDADAIVCHGLFGDCGSCVAEKRGIPLVIAYLFPLLACDDWGERVREAGRWRSRSLREAR